jgi:molybdate transport system ATP-binding protein
MTLKLSIKQSLHHFDLAIDVELTIGGIIGLFGHSGSGKTSLLRAIAGLSNHAIGQIEFSQQHWQLNGGQLKNIDCEIGMVFQDSRLFEHLKVTKNLSIVDKLGCSDTSNKLINDFGIKPLLDKFAHQLSAGQQQRVAIVRSLLANPQLLLLDEPLSALDNSAKKSLMAVLKNYSQQQSLTMIYVSHHIEEINTLCDQLMLIEQGQLIDSGHSEDVLSRHRLLPHQSDVIAVDKTTNQITLQLSDEAFVQLSQRKIITIGNQ